MRWALFVPLLLTAGCNKMVGNLLAGTTNDVVLPEIMGTGDIGMACASGEALGGMIAAYGQWSKKAHQGSVMTHMSAAMCLDDDVWAAQLAGQRAAGAGDVAGAKDALAVERRMHAVAASRYLAAHQALLDTWGVPEPGEDCPKLKHEGDQLAYMLGLSAGVLAVLHDLAVGGDVGVPLTIPAGVERGAACLDDDHWWGVPRAMMASLWALQPGKPGADDPWVTFAESTAKGRAANVRLAGAFYAQTAATVGAQDKLRAAISEHADAVSEAPAASQWRMLDNYALASVLHESDRIWTGLEGHRTPWGELGTFPDDVAEEAAPLDGDLFDDLLE